MTENQECIQDFFPSDIWEIMVGLQKGGGGKTAHWLPQVGVAGGLSLETPPIFLTLLQGQQWW